MENVFFFFSISEILHTVFLTAILILSSLSRYIPTIAVLHVFCEQQETVVCEMLISSMPKNGVQTDYQMLS